jgi:hypothetical protein
MQRLLERIEHEARMRCARGAPADDPACEGVDHKGNIDEALPSGDIKVKSDTHSAFGRGAWNCRLTLSSGRAALRSLTVVFTGLPRTAPPSQPLGADQRSASDMGFRSALLNRHARTML